MDFKVIIRYLDGHIETLWMQATTKDEAIAASWKEVEFPREVQSIRAEPMSDYDKKMMSVEDARESQQEDEDWHADLTGDIEDPMDDEEKEKLLSPQEDYESAHPLDFEEEDEMEGSPWDHEDDEGDYTTAMDSRRGMRDERWKVTAIIEVGDDETVKHKTFHVDASDTTVAHEVAGHKLSHLDINDYQILSVEPDPRKKPAFSDSRRGLQDDIGYPRWIVVCDQIIPGRKRATRKNLIVDDEYLDGYTKITPHEVLHEMTFKFVQQWGSEFMPTNIRVAWVESQNETPNFEPLNWTGLDILHLSMKDINPKLYAWQKERGMADARDRKREGVFKHVEVSVADQLYNYVIDPSNRNVWLNLGDLADEFRSNDEDAGIHELSGFSSNEIIDMIVDTAEGDNNFEIRYTDDEKHTYELKCKNLLRVT